MDKRLLIKKAIITLLVVAVSIGCVAYILPDLKSLRGICDLLITWFSVGILIDLIKTVVNYVSNLITSSEDDTDKGN